jgi:IS30 family transposase|tara:strand:- start:22 stop:276 length:255 start_codon:yes stop_codon:yes gene_type:complete
MVERETKITILVLLDGITLEATKEGIIRRLTSRKKHVLTLTSDNGKEFPGQSEISEKFGSAFYFLHALSQLGARLRREYQLVGA